MTVHDMVNFAIALSYGVMAVIMFRTLWVIERKRRQQKLAREKREQLDDEAPNEIPEGKSGGSSSLRSKR